MKCGGNDLPDSSESCFVASPRPGNKAALRTAQVRCSFTEEQRFPIGRRNDSHLAVVTPCGLFLHTRINIKLTESDNSPATKIEYEGGWGGGITVMVPEESGDNQ